MEPVVLDTDVASLSLKGKLPPDVLRLLDGRVPLITFVTLAELTRWVEQRQWGAHRRERLARWLVGRHVLHTDDDVARTWGVITAYAYLRGRPRPTNDSWIAACCLAYDLPLATLNVKTSKTSLRTKACASSVASPCPSSQCRSRETVIGCRHQRYPL